MCFCESKLYLQELTLFEKEGKTINGWIASLESVSIHFNTFQIHENWWRWQQNKILQLCYSKEKVYEYSFKINRYTARESNSTIFIFDFLHNGSQLIKKKNFLP